MTPHITPKCVILMVRYSIKLCIEAMLLSSTGFGFPNLQIEILKVMQSLTVSKFKPFIFYDDNCFISRHLLAEN